MDEPKKRRPIRAPLDLNAEIEKATAGLRPRSFEEELRKALAPFHVANPAAELAKAFSGFRPFSLENELRKAVISPSHLGATWRASVAALQHRDPLAEARRAINITRADVLRELDRVAAVALAPQPAVEALLAASLVAYQNLYGRYAPPSTTWRRSERPQAKVPKRRTSGRRRARRRPSAPQRPPVPQRPPAPTVAASAQPDEASLSAAVEKIEAASRKRDISLLAFELILSTIIGILMMLYQNQLSNESERRIVSRIAAVEASLTERIADLEKQHDYRPMVYARRELALQTAPRSRAAVVATWYPNVPGRVVAERKYWARVEYFDATKNEHVAGWCRKKWLLKSRAAG